MSHPTAMRSSPPPPLHLRPPSSCTSSSPLSSPPPDITPLNNSGDEYETRTDITNNLWDGDSDIDGLGDSIDAPTYAIRGKLQTVVKSLRQVGWSFEQFIHVWIKESAEIKHRRYRTAAQRRTIFRKTLLGMPKVIAQCGFASVIKAELDELIKQPYFGKSDHTAEINTIDFNAVGQIIKDTAPTLHTILSYLLRNSRAHQSSYKSDRSIKELNKRLFTIISIICHSRKAKNSKYLSSMLDAYLLRSGVKREVIETLANLGLCHSYTQGNRLRKQIAEHEKTQ